MMGGTSSSCRSQSMTPMNDLIGRDLRQAFPDVDWTSCSIGEPVGPGLRIGYEGWGDPHVALNPSLPLDMCIERLGLKHSFQRVYSEGLLNCVHGDCVLMHTANGLKNALGLGGELRIKVLGTAAVATSALIKLDKGDLIGCQVLEKLCFKMPFDRTGLVYQQTFIDERRLIAAFSGCLHIESACSLDDVPERPDDLRIPAATDDAAWLASSGNMAMSETISRDWPRCACCRRVATKADWNRSMFSRYCRNHYQTARELWEETILDAYSITGVLHG